jgi:hypothetical protein
MIRHGGPTQIQRQAGHPPNKSRAARNRLALSADLYLLYYLDQLMADARRHMDAAVQARAYSRQHRHAIHRVYWLMRRELDSRDTDRISPSEVIGSMLEHERRAASVLEALRSIDDTGGSSS